MAQGNALARQVPSYVPHPAADTVGASTAATLEDHVLLQRCQQGDQGAFWWLWHSYRDELLTRYSLPWMRGNHADAEDVLSSSGIKAWQYLTGSPTSITCIKAWLIHLLRNKCIDLWKAQERRTTQLQRLTRNQGEVYPKHGSAHESPEETLLRHELGRVIHRTLESLPPRLRTAAIMRFVYDMSYEEIATRLSLRPANVRKRIQHARVLIQAGVTAYRSEPNGALKAVSHPWSAPPRGAGRTRSVCPTRA